VGLAPWTLLTVLVYLAAVSRSGCSTVPCVYLHNMARCFCGLEVPLKLLHRPPFSHLQGHACSSCIANFLVRTIGSLKGLCFIKTKGPSGEETKSARFTCYRVQFLSCSTDTPVSLQVSDPFNVTLLLQRTCVSCKALPKGLHSIL